MQKIIVAIDGLKYSESAVEYAVFFAKKTESQLVGVFLEDFTYHSYKLSQLAGAHGETEEEIEELEKKDAGARKESVQHFETRCRQEGIKYAIHYDRSIALQELLHETVYADLLVISGDETLTRYEEEKPTRFVRELLEQSQCPVIVTPPAFKTIKNVVMLYDGEPSSVYAIKTFSYLLNPLRYLVSEMLFVSSHSSSAHIPDNRLLKEFMKNRFPTVNYKILVGDAGTEIINHLKETDQYTLVVLGAYRKGMVSRLVKHTMADILMKSIKAPLFISHNK